MTTSILPEQTKSTVTPATKETSVAKRRTARRKATPARKVVRAKKAPVTRHRSKTAKVLDLLKRPAGVTLKELTKVTGWQAHSVRGFLSGTIGKKMGTPVESFQRVDGERAYRLSACDPHQHHQIIHPVFTPAAQPAHVPVAEPGAQCHRSAKAKVLRLHLHAASRHSFCSHINASSACGMASPLCRGASGVGCRDYSTIFAVVLLAPRFHSTSGAAGSSFSISQWMAKRSFPI